MLRVRLGPVWRVVYDPKGWSRVPRSLDMDHRSVRLDPYGFELFDTMYFFGAEGARIVLRVVPAATDADLASAILLATARHDGALDPTAAR